MSGFQLEYVGVNPIYRSTFKGKHMDEIALEFCRMSDERYQSIRDRHYIPNNGSHGQQIHFLIHYKGNLVGIISGGSSVYAVKSRDDFFGIPKDQKIKQEYYLSAIINNTVFRLEYREKNLATKVLSKWRKVIAKIWEEMYGVPVIGFETFVIETDTPKGAEKGARKGTLYMADNWTFVGRTAGNTKQHKSGGLTQVHLRLNTEPKLIFCKKTTNEKPTVAYKSSWRAITQEEKDRAKKLAELRKILIGKTF